MDVKLIVVDDEVEICDFVKRFFAERSFEVFTAYNGREALGVIEAKDPHIVLLDIKMPVLDGIETLKELNKRQKRCKVVMLTAVSDEKTMKEAKNCGAVDYITKPLSLENLEKCVLSLAEGFNANAVASCSEAQ